MTKIILDTDIGDDIDDAFAVTLAAISPEIELLGVTTVFRNAMQRAKMCRRLLDELGSSAPVYAGLNEPLIQRVEDIMPEQFKKNEKFGPDGLYILPQWEEEMSGERVEAENAVDFIIRTAHAHAGELVLVPVGPLTNIGVALRKDPSIKPKIRKIVLMGGWEAHTYAEWNIACDPEAAHIVYTSEVPVEAVGLDVTLHCRWTDEMVETFRARKTGSSRLLSRMMEKWFGFYQFEAPIMHDPLTIASIINPEFLKTEIKRKRIGLAGPERGYVFDAKQRSVKDGDIEIPVSVDREAYMKFFTERIFN